jgi:DNA-binding transcriptional MerR regulator
MIISQVVRITKLTKKAVRYYESVGLIKSTVLKNGYKDYSKEEVDRLVIIKSLRELSFSIEEIKLCFADESILNSNINLKIKQLESEKRQLSVTIDFLNNFVSHNCKLNDVQNLQEEMVKINENYSNQLLRQLRFLFPGDFGEIIAAVYGQFLDVNIETSQQKEAWNNLLKELDEVEPFDIPQNLVEWAIAENSHREKFENNVVRLKDEYNKSYEEFNDLKKEAINKNLDQLDKNKKMSSSNDLVLFLSKNCGELFNIFGKYLPLISNSYNQFYLKQSKFISENPQLIKKLNDR